MVNPLSETTQFETLLTQKGSDSLSAFGVRLFLLFHVYDALKYSVLVLE